MGVTAENLQEMYDIPREQSDEFACNSQMRAAKAWEDGKFEGEIVPVVIPATRKTPEIVFDKDEHIRPDTTREGLAKLKTRLQERRHRDRRKCFRPKRRFGFRLDDDTGKGRSVGLFSHGPLDQRCRLRPWIPKSWASGRPMPLSRHFKWPI